MATILIVDDEESVRSIISMALIDNYHVIEASNGADGLKKFEQYQPDLIITDIIMPVMNGIEMVCKLRALSSQVRIIAFSTFHRVEDQEEILRAGADLCLAKPSTLSILEQAVNQLLTDRPKANKAKQSANANHGN